MWTKYKNTLLASIWISKKRQKSLDKNNNHCSYTAYVATFIFIFQFHNLLVIILYWPEKPNKSCKYGKTCGEKNCIWLFYFLIFFQFTHCKMQKKEGYPGSTSLGEGVSKGSLSPPLEVVISAWRNAVAGCRSCRRKRRSTSPLVREAALVARSVGLDLETGAESRAHFDKVRRVFISN